MKKTLKLISGNLRFLSFYRIGDWPRFIFVHCQVYLRLLLLFSAKSKFSSKTTIHPLDTACRNEIDKPIKIKGGT